MKRRALVVDDSSSIRSVMSAVLEQGGWEVDTADDGDTAVACLDGRVIDAIVCDLNMPRMDGLSFLRLLRNHPRYRRTPFVVLSTESRPHMKLALKTGGAQAYMQKPCRPSDLLETVHRICP